VHGAGDVLPVLNVDPADQVAPVWAGHPCPGLAVQVGVGAGVVVGGHVGDAVSQTQQTGHDGRIRAA